MQIILEAATLLFGRSLHMHGVESATLCRGKIMLGADAAAGFSLFG